MRKTALLLDSTHLQIDHGPYSLAETLHTTETPPYCNRVWLAAGVLKSMAGKSKITYRGNAAHCTLWQRAARTFECSSLSPRHLLNSQTIKYPNKKKSSTESRNSVSTPSEGCSLQTPGNHHTGN